MSEKKMIGLRDVEMFQIVKIGLDMRLQRVMGGWIRDRIVSNTFTSVFIPETKALGGLNEKYELIEH